MIAPVHNEEVGLPELYRRLHDVLEQTGEPWELLLVNDGSRDQSAQVIHQLHEHDPHVVGLSLSRNFGFGIALLSGLAILVVIALRLLDAGPPLMGQATTLVTVLFLGGVQLISLGIIGEYLGRIYDEVKHRPLYLVAEQWGLDDAE